MFKNNSIVNITTGNFLYPLGFYVLGATIRLGTNIILFLQPSLLDGSALGIASTRIRATNCHGKAITKLTIIMNFSVVRLVNFRFNEQKYFLGFLLWHHLFHPGHCQCWSIFPFKIRYFFY